MVSSPSGHHTLDGWKLSQLVAQDKSSFRITSLNTNYDSSALLINRILIPRLGPELNIPMQLSLFRLFHL